MSTGPVTDMQATWLRRVRVVSDEYEHVRRWRDEIIRAAAAEGLSARTIAPEAGLSFSQVARIVKAGR